MDDLPRSDRPSTPATEVNNTKVKEMVTENPYSTLRQSHGTFCISRVDPYHFK